MPEFDPAIRAYYERGQEAARLTDFGTGPLELARTQELILRGAPAIAASVLDVLDVGGGPGAYAAWLASLGHHVHLVDPIVLHVEQARAASARVTVEVGDARSLTQPDASFDVVLLLGPLYHLIDREDRLVALREARRVLRPGGRLFAAGISRYAALFDLLVRVDALHEPDVFGVVSGAIERGGVWGADAALFTTAYFHRADELAEELTAAGLAVEAVYNIEGPGAWVHDFADRWADEVRRDALLQAARLVETEPSLMGSAGHLLAVATPST